MTNIQLPQHSFQEAPLSHAVKPAAPLNADVTGPSPILALKCAITLELGLQSVLEHDQTKVDYNWWIAQKELLLCSIALNTEKQPPVSKKPAR